MADVVNYKPVDLVRDRPQFLRVHRCVWKILRMHVNNLRLLQSFARARATHNECAKALHGAWTFQFAIVFLVHGFGGHKYLHHGAQVLIVVRAAVYEYILKLLLATRLIDEASIFTARILYEAVLFRTNEWPGAFLRLCRLSWKLFLLGFLRQVFGVECFHGANVTKRRPFLGVVTALFGCHPRAFSLRKMAVSSS